MSTIMKTASILTIPLMIFSFAGCAIGNNKVLYRGSFEGKQFTVRTHVTATFNGSRTDWRLKLDGHPALPINIIQRWGTPVALKEPETTDWGPPYSDEIYGKYERMYLVTAPAYTNVPYSYHEPVKRLHDYTMLYMPPGLSSKDFNTYARLLKTEWAAVDKALTADSESCFPHLIGLVNAPRPLFIKRFRGTKDGVQYELRIDPDGFVDVQPGEPYDRNHVMHSPVQMPRKAIRIHTIYGNDVYALTVTDIRTFRDSQGHAIEEYFKLED